MFLGFVTEGLPGDLQGFSLFQPDARVLKAIPDLPRGPTHGTLPAKTVDLENPAPS